MTTIKATEDEFKNQLISWLNESISYRNFISEVTNGTNSIKILEFTKYI